MSRPFSVALFVVSIAGMIAVPLCFLAPSSALHSLPASSVPECSHTTVLFSDDPSYGFGSVMNKVLDFAIVAALEGRAVSWDDTGFPFGAYTDYFLPIRPCPAWDNNVSDVVRDHIALLGISCRPRDACPWECRGPALTATRSWFPDRTVEPGLRAKVFDAVEQTFEVLKAHPTLFHPLHGTGLGGPAQVNAGSTWSGSWPPNYIFFLRRLWMQRLMQPSPERQREARGWMKDNDLWPVGSQHYIAMHVRRGDKLQNEAHLVPDDAYITKVEQIMPSRPVIVLFSDDVHVYPAMKTKRPEWRWLSIAGPPSWADREAWAQAHGHIDATQWAKFSTEERRSGTMELFRAMLVASEADYVIMTETSNIGRLLHLSRGWDISRTISMDIAWQDY